MADDGDKTEEPTAKKLNDAFSKGQFAKTQEMGTTFILAVALALFAFTIQDKAIQVRDFASSKLGHLYYENFNFETVLFELKTYQEFIFRLLTPLLFAVVLATILSGGIQSGFKPTFGALKANPGRINPVKGVQNLISKQKLVQFGVDLLKFIIMGGILADLIRVVMNDPIFSSPIPLTYLGEFMYRLFVSMLGRLVIVMIMITIIDYMFQRWKTHEDMKMTKQEVKDEMKQQMGDPHMKAAQKKQGMMLLAQAMKKNVPRADVVVTNPTHFAVALKYEQGVDAAPIVVAKGEGRIALRIKEIATENGVPMVENKEVARMLFRVTNIGQAIPIELFEVVAKILAHVYKTHRYYFHRLKALRMAESASKSSN
jgi:flagellar biosynthetic protein FlhB